MKPKFMQLLATVILLLASSWAQAAITCTAPSSSGFSTAYAPTGVVPNVTQGSVSFTCTRGLAGDATSVLLRSRNDGLNKTLVQNRARLGATANYISYEAYKNSGCSAVWTSLVTADFITVTLLSVLTPQPITVNYWGCITLAGQAVPAGDYTDTVTMRIRNNTDTANLSGSNTFPVTITNPASCTVTSIQNVAFGTYVAFRSTPLAAPAADIVLNCTAQLPYTLALDATSGVVAGLNYSLVLSANSSRGTGPGQTHTITGTMPANQAGTCSSGSCSASQSHTLTITY